MSDYEFFNRMINKIDKDYGYDIANKFQRLFIKKENENIELQQENTHLKEKINYYEQEIIVKDTNILTELEEWLKEHIEKWKDTCSYAMNSMVEEDKNILDKIQELKEKYK